jgi:hypothetical protein
MLPLNWIGAVISYLDKSMLPMGVETWKNALNCIGRIIFRGSSSEKTKMQKLDFILYFQDTVFWIVWRILKAFSILTSKLNRVAKTSKLDFLVATDIYYFWTQKNMAQFDENRYTGKNLLRDANFSRIFFISSNIDNF